MNEIIAKIRSEVHKDLNFKRYEETHVREDTNCMAHAIGSQAVNVGNAYRVGFISGKKKEDEKYFSKEEVKELFLEDLKVIELEATELQLDGKDMTFREIEQMSFENNEHAAVLFVKTYADGRIFDFHFLRFDKGVGWTEKRYGCYPSYLDRIDISWPESWDTKFVAAFKITR